jgi:hypothetical protein
MEAAEVVPKELLRPALARLVCDPPFQLAAATKQRPEKRMESRGGSSRGRAIPASAATAGERITTAISLGVPLGRAQRSGLATCHSDALPAEL